MTNDSNFDLLCKSTEEGFLQNLFNGGTTVEFEETLGGTRILVNKNWIGWLLSTTNDQWTFTILKKYMPNDPYKTKQEAQEAIANFISDWHTYLDKKFGVRRSAELKIDTDDKHLPLTILFTENGPKEQSNRWWEHE